MREEENIFGKKVYFELKEDEGSGAPLGAYVGSATLTSEQIDFTTDSFTEQAITTIYDKFLDILDNKQHTRAVA